MRTKDRSWLFYGKTDIELKMAGYLNRSLSRKNSTKDDDVVIVGDSTVRCTRLDMDEAWPARLESAFHSNDYANVKVCNLGEGGSGPEKNEMRLRNYLTTHSPSMLIYSSSLGADASLEAVKLLGRYVPVQIAGRSVLDCVDRYILRKSLLYLTLREKIAKMGGKEINSMYIDIAMRQLPSNRSLVDGLGIKLYREHLISVARLSKKLGIDIIMISFPTGELSPVYDLDYDKTYRQFCLETERISKEFGIPYINLYAKFQTMTDRSSYFFFPDQHRVNSRGAQKEADMVFEYLNEHHLINRLSSK